MIYNRDLPYQLTLTYRGLKPTSPTRKEIMRYKTEKECRELLHGIEKKYFCMKCNDISYYQCGRL